MDERAERLAGSDPEAFSELYDICADRVHHYLVVLLGSRADADDVLQETFVRLARSRKRLFRVENMIGYVFATARNEAHRLFDRRARKPRMTADLSQESLFHEAASDDQRDIETAEWIAVSLARLDRELREIVELKIYANLTFREIADVTGIPQGTLATRYRKALEMMRIHLVKEPE